MTSPYDRLVAASSPLGWWKLDDPSGSSTAADSSGNGWTGTPTSVTFGNPGPRVSDGGTSAGYTGTGSGILTSLNPSGYTAATLEAWVYVTQDAQAANPRLVANSHADQPLTGYELYMNAAVSPVCAFTSGTIGDVLASTVHAPFNTWHYVVATWTAGAQTILYCDGLQIDQVATAITGTIGAGAAGTGLGYDPAYNGDYLYGRLAQCAVYDKALSAAQVRQRWNAGLATGAFPAVPSLIAAGAV